jgi:hypothetical protein
MANGDNFSEGAGLLWMELDEDALLPAGAAGAGRANCRATKRPRRRVAATGTARAWGTWYRYS